MTRVKINNFNFNFNVAYCAWGLPCKLQVLAAHNNIITKNGATTNKIEQKQPYFKE